MRVQSDCEYKMLLPNFHIRVQSDCDYKMLLPNHGKCHSDDIRSSIPHCISWERFYNIVVKK